MIVGAPGVGVFVGFALCPVQCPKPLSDSPLLLRITPNGEAMPAGGLGRPDAASQLVMYVSAASVGDVHIRITAVRCLRPRSTYTVFSWRSLFTQRRGKSISANFAITEFSEVRALSWCSDVLCALEHIHCPQAGVGCPRCTTRRGGADESRPGKGDGLYEAHPSVVDGSGPEGGDAGDERGASVGEDER